MEYLEGVGISYAGRLPKIKKKDKVFLQPIFEAFTNSLESIKILKDRHQYSEKGKITLNIYLKKDIFSDQTEVYDFQKIEITDTGVGFDDKEFKRLIALDDNTKGFSNKGSGRIQFLHTFDKTEITSIYRDESSSTGFRQRIFTLSKSKSFLLKNAIIRLEKGDKEEVETTNSFTSLTFNTILLQEDVSYFKNLRAEELKENIIERYLAQFCENREYLPQIIIKTIINDNVATKLEIISDDIPTPDQEKDIDVYYSKVDGRNVEKTSNKETLNLKAFKIPQNRLDKNGLKLVSKGEIAKGINLENLLKTDQIDGNRFLFLLSGEYIDNRDSDVRGEINIPKKADFKKRNSDSFLSEEEILLEDIEEKTNRIILGMYDEIKAKNEEKKQNIKELQKMFLLNPKTLSALGKKIGINDSDDTILRKVYEVDAKIIAKGDAEIKHQIKELSKLNTTEEDYNDKLRVQVDELVKAIPLQNKAALTHYVARRKLVLELFDKIIKKQLEIQQTDKRNIDEKLLHNLIFQQSSDDTGESDLWLVNEDFIYFKGTSEGQLGKILLDDDTIIKEKLSPEEEAYRLKQEGDANQKRPDILLFPKEGKCIIIEFKSLDTNIAEHLNQINRYASLINNLSKDEYNFTTYYGYLIGENIDVDDIQDNDSDFISAHQLDFIFRPYKRIIGKFGKSDGSLYTEVIKYSTLLERALERNKIFIDKITKPIE